VDVVGAAREAGHSMPTVRRAAKDVKAKIEQLQDSDSGKVKAWQWSI